MNFARRIKKLTGRDAPEKMAHALNWFREYGSCQDPIGMTKEQVLGDDDVTTIAELAEHQPTASPSTLRIWFYGEDGVRSGTVLSMLLDRILLTYAARPMLRPNTCRYCGARKTKPFP